jgi:hypothetical protein
MQRVFFFPCQKKFETDKSADGDSGRNDDAIDDAIDDARAGRCAIRS